MEHHEITIKEFTVLICGKDATITNPDGAVMHMKSSVLRDLGKFAAWVISQQDGETVEPPPFDDALW
jgi:hypothetical protein